MKAYAQVTWDGLAAETLAFGSSDTVDRHIEHMRDPRRRPRALLDELRRPALGEDPPLDGAVRARGDAGMGDALHAPDAVAY